MSKLAKQNEPPPVVLTCNYCGNEASLMCSRCLEIYYCRPEHQKEDWRNHSNKCKSQQVQTKEFYTFKRERNIELFYLLSCLKSSKAEDITDEILTLECALINKYQNISNLDHFQSIGRLVEYGATVCMKIRQRIIAKDMNEAGEILDQYLNGNEFIADTKNMMLPLSDDPRTFEQQKRVVFGKLRLIATITNLYRELIGVDDKIFSIIIRHVKAIYGEKSLELSNIYFMIGIFLNSTKQLNLRQKAMVCFIRAAYMRKEQGGVAWYNVALLLKEFGVKNYAMTYFNKALAMLQAQRHPKLLNLIPCVYENIALLHYENNFLKQMIDAFEKALYYRQKLEDKDGCEKILKLFASMREELRKEAGDEAKSMSFPKEMKESRQPVNLSNTNYQRFNKAHKEHDDTSALHEEWRKGFHEVSTIFQPSLIKFPKEVELLIGNNKRKDQRENLPQYLASSDNSFGESIQIDLQYISSLTSTEVEYLHQLNHLLSEFKERTAIYGIVENSNFVKTVAKDKLANFYKQNPGLVPPSDTSRKLAIMDMASKDVIKEVSEAEEDQSNFFLEKKVQPLPTPSKRAGKMPTLDLQGIRKMKEQRNRRK